MPPINRPWWEQVTALVSLSVSGALTGFSFVPKAPAELKSPSGMPIHLMALEKAARPVAADDAALRSAIINVTNYFLRMAESKTPAQMEAIIWHHDSIDGVDHGESCAAFASLTLGLAAQAVGQQSWVTGGTSYPWPLHKWADVRVGPNPDSLGIVSVLQDAEAHQRWHPLGDGYTPLPGDWVLFDGHVEVVTKYTGGALQTVGGDSLPNFSVNAHTYPGPLADQGVTGFVNNGHVAGMEPGIAGSGEAVSGSQTTPSPHQHRSGGGRSGQARGQASLAATGQAAGASAARARHEHGGGDQAAGRARIPGAPGGSARLKVPHARGDAAVPGLPVPAPRPHRDAHSASQHHPADRAQARQNRTAPEPGGHPRQAGLARTTSASAGAGQGAAAIPGLPAAAKAAHGRARSAPPAAPTGALSRGPAGSAAPGERAAPSAGPYGRHDPAAQSAPADNNHAEQAFINEIAPWAMASQRRYGVPASVTIAQAIDESGWGQSVLATNDHNLFGIKGAGPAGSDVAPTTEYQSGQLVGQTSPFRVYHNIAESVDDHGKLLATSPYYRQVMADRGDPNAFAAALTGIYATDPQYGAKLIGLMQRYNLYRYDMTAPGSTAHQAAPGTKSRGGARSPSAQPAAPGPTHTAAPAPPQGTPGPSPTPHSGTPTSTPTVGPTPGPHTTTPTVVRQSPARNPSQRTGTATRAPRPATPTPGADPVIPGVIMPAAQPSPTRHWGTAGAGADAGTQNPAQRAAATTGPPQSTTRRAAPHIPAPPAPPSSGAPRGTNRPASAYRPQHTAVPVAPKTAAPSAAPRAADPAAPRQAAAPGRSAGTTAPRPAPRAAAPQSPARRSPTRPGAAGGAEIPGLPAIDTSAQVSAPRQVPSSSGTEAPAQLDAYQAAAPAAAADGAQLRRPPSPLDWQKQRIASHRSHPGGRRYQHHIPPSVWTVLIATARGRLLGEERLYRDVASLTGIRWELLAACDWMQCKARPGYSPVQGEKLGAVNADRTVYHTKSEALEQCAEDLVELAGNVYRIDLTAPGELSICELANVFAAFRWGGLLRLHHTSAMEFPYSVSGLTVQHTSMRWPKIDEPNAPDKPGSRFRMPFGAVPVVLSLNYPATI